MTKATFLSNRFFILPVPLNAVAEAEKCLDGGQEAIGQARRSERPCPGDDVGAEELVWRKQDVDGIL